MTLQISARNQFHAKVKSVTLGSVMAEVVLELASGQELVSAVTRTSVERLQIRAGADVLAIIKATEVVLGKEE